MPFFSAPQYVAITFLERLGKELLFILVCLVYVLWLIIHRYLYIINFSPSKN